MQISRLWLQDRYSPQLHAASGEQRPRFRALRLASATARVFAILLMFRTTDSLDPGEAGYSPLRPLFAPLAFGASQVIHCQCSLSVQGPSVGHQQPLV